MRMFFRTCIFLIIIFLLSGCAALNQMMQGVSNKRTESAPAPTPTPKCENWCHNGWCSTHCENSPNGEQY